MASKSAPPEKVKASYKRDRSGDFEPKKKAKPRRRVSTFNPRAWAKDRIKEDKLELAMLGSVHAVLENRRRKLRRKIKREEKDLLAPAPVAPDFPMKVPPARAKK